jgi:hypothetical protein
MRTNQPEDFERWFSGTASAQLANPNKVTIDHQRTYTWGRQQSGRLCTRTPKVRYPLGTAPINSLALSSLRVPVVLQHKLDEFKTSWRADRT